ncbi:hypothetical protein OHB26_39370 (plasmid) [Nocardia sp. NBC_01503]|uniref:hypothetical protein n=1 Tax=Nocardia sp. NBC_01503 TaxID=2975997 RepID=UPI002E7BCE01|nr:hypothetical protein [Nocardia sp. NBC_01503]WTL36707.1 hypothetical protein OHB26_39205 [Nocardia sp. NBC_01503]WTL36740.1 hypothetical protein OHB26_39370 [Nocardia sp. NBC_01503]
MHRNNIKPIVIGVGAGAVTIGALLAWFELDPPHALREAVERLRLTPAERAEWKHAKTAEAARTAKLVRQHEQRKAATWAKFDPAILTAAAAGTGLAELTVPELLAEIEAAQAAKKSAWVADWTAETSQARAVWDDQLGALREEFDRRRWGRNRLGVPLFDQARLGAAWDWVHDHNREMPEPKPWTPPAPIHPAAPLPWEGAAAAEHSQAPDKVDIPIPDWAGECCGKPMRIIPAGGRYGAQWLMYCEPDEGCGHNEPYEHEEPSGDPEEFIPDPDPFVLYRSPFHNDPDLHSNPDSE